MNMVIEARQSELPGRTGRCWLRYSLRGLLAFIVAAALPAWWLRSLLDDFAAEHEAIESLRGAGVLVEVCPADPKWFWSRAPKSIAPHCEFAVVVHSIGIIRPITAAEMPAFARLNNLASLEISDSAIIDDDLVACRNLRKLWRLHLTNCRRLTGDGLRYFAEARQITELDLSFTPIGDSGMQAVGELHALRTLDLRYTLVTDASTAQIARLRGLWSLRLPRGVTSRGLRDIAALPELGGLSIWLADGDDLAAFEAISRLPTLEGLEICGDGPSPAALEVVAAAPTLKSLWIRTTSIDDHALAVFKNTPRLRSLALKVELTKKDEEESLYVKGRQTGHEAPDGEAIRTKREAQPLRRGVPRARADGPSGPGKNE